LNQERITILEKLGISYKPGRKGPNDKIFYYNGKPISMKQFGELYAELCKNEDELYPKSEGFMGSDMFTNFLKDVKETGGVTPEIMKIYHLK